jgi:hypothetical protein
MKGILTSKETDLSKGYSEYENNIKKCINNCKQSDKKKLNWTGKGKLDSIGNIDYEFINKLINLWN